MMYLGLLKTPYIIHTLYIIHRLQLEIKNRGIRALQTVQSLSFRKRHQTWY